MLRELITVNPRSVKANPRKKGKAKKKHRAAYRRNPRGFLPSTADITNTLVPAAIGGAGALGLDIALGQLTMIPPEWQSGARRTLLRGAIAFAVGFAARSFLPARYKRMADQATAGALTITAYDAAKSFVSEQFPQLTLGMYAGDLAAYERTNWGALPVLQSKNGNGMNAYVPAGGGADLGMIPVTR
jgi:hypothetical protein